MLLGEVKAGMVRLAASHVTAEGITQTGRRLPLDGEGRESVVVGPNVPCVPALLLNPPRKGAGVDRNWGWSGGTILALICLTAPALAGDRAGISFLGYSEDAHYFAFEEFGIQDGSGFAYANLHVPDLATDTWVKDTPVRVRVEDENSTIATVRADAMGQAQPTLGQLDIGHPVDIIVLNDDGALDIDDQTLRFGRPGHGMSAPDQTYELSLATVSDGIDPPDCAEWGEAHVAGFALNLTVDEKTREVYRDKTVPETRGCPQDYRLYAVVTPFDDLAAFAPDRTPGMVAIVSVYSMGFEGPDRRFIAVPLGR